MLDTNLPAIRSRPVMGPNGGRILERCFGSSSVLATDAFFLHLLPRVPYLDVLCQHPPLTNLLFCDSLLHGLVYTNVRGTQERKASAGLLYILSLLPCCGVRPCRALPIRQHLRAYLRRQAGSLHLSRLQTSPVSCRLPA